MATPAVAGQCPDCGVENAADHNYCKHCGTPLRAIDVEYVIACYQLGVVRERQNDVEGAVACFERVVAANPHDASAHYHLGLGYERQGLEALAMSALAQALQLDPSDTAAAEELQDLQR